MRMYNKRNSKPQKKQMEACLKISDIESIDEINVDSVYDFSVKDNSNYYIYSGKNILVHNSSKTRSIIQILLFLALTSEKRISVVSYTLPHLKGGAMKDLDEEIINLGLNPAKYKNSSDNTYYFNKSYIQFFGVEGPAGKAKAHGPRRDILFVNEANNKIDYETFDQLNQRTHQLTMIDFNPRNEFWYHDKIKPNFEHAYIQSNFLDNPYLPDREVQNIMSKHNKPGFENWWRVYGLGELGKFEGVILPNWRYGDFDDNLNYFFGMDYGFFPDPDALVKVAIDEGNKKIYAKELMYSNSQGTETLIANISKYVTKSDLIVAESATPRTNADLKKHFRIFPVQKTKTVADWLRELQNYEIIVSPESYNLGKELNNYIWMDKKAGVPIDANNHLLDGLRYSLMYYKSKSSVPFIG